MTAGPARRTVTLLPKNKPTPMAPPMAIMVSCLWPRRRWRPSTSGVAGTDGSGSDIAANPGAFKNQQIDILLEDFRDCLNVVHGVVDMKRYAQAVLAVRGDDAAFSKLLHQQIRIFGSQDHQRSHAIRGSFDANSQIDHPTQQRLR